MKRLGAFRYFPCKKRRGIYPLPPSLEALDGVTNPSANLKEAPTPITSWPALIWTRLRNAATRGDSSTGSGIPNRTRPPTKLSNVTSWCLLGLWESNPSHIRTNLDLSSRCIFKANFAG